MSFSVKLEGFKGLSKKLNLLGKNGSKMSRKALSKAALLAKRDAKSLAPVDTGELRKSIRIGRRKTRKKDLDIVAIFSPLNTANLIEFGTARHLMSVRGVKKVSIGDSGDVVFNSFVHPGFDAQPFLRPAVERNAKAIISEYGNKLDDEIRKFVSKTLGRR